MALFSRENRSETSVLVDSLPRSMVNPLSNGSLSSMAEVSEGLYPGVNYVDYSEKQASGRNGGHVLIVHRTTSGEVNLHSFEEVGAAQMFLEGLLTDGASQDAIECYQASSLKLAVSFRPVVHLGGA